MRIAGAVMARAVSMGRRDVLAFAREAASLPRRIDLNRIALRRIASDRMFHAALALAHLTLAVAVSTAMSDTIGLATAAGVSLSAAGAALMVLLRAGAPTDTDVRSRQAAYDEETRVEAATRLRPFTPETTGREVNGLLALMNHELRTPLNAILGNADAIRLDAFGPVGTARYRECAAHIREGGQAMLRAAEDMMALTGAVAAATFVPHQPVDLEDMVRDALRDALPAAKSRQIELSWQSATSRPVISEATALRHAIVRVIDAALAHATEGSSIHVEIGLDRRNVELLVTLSSRDQSGFAEGARLDIGSDRSPAALQLAVARTLFALLGTHLHAAHGIDGRWRAIVDLPAVTSH
jgi:signal transduction histidine kinase